MSLLERIPTLPSYELENLSMAFLEGKRAYADETNPYTGQDNDLETAWDWGFVAYADDENPFEV